MQQRIFVAVHAFDAFDRDNDPWHEHDFGALDIDGERVFFKLEYYDLARAMHSEDAAGHDNHARRRILSGGNIMYRASTKRAAKGRLRQPYRQGDLDGLCGVYSAVNAVRALCPEVDHDTAGCLFETMPLATWHRQASLYSKTYGSRVSQLRQVLDRFPWSVSLVEKRTSLRRQALGG